VVRQGSAKSSSGVQIPSTPLQKQTKFGLLFICLHIVIKNQVLRTDVTRAHRDLPKGKGVSLSKGCIRYSKPGKIDFKVAKMMLKETQESTGTIYE
jgi:hypothetical protein